jgi:hypothetical protein
MYSLFVDLLRGGRRIKHNTLSLTAIVAVQRTNLFTRKAIYVTFASFIARQHHREND